MFEWSIAVFLSILGWASLFLGYLFAADCYRKSVRGQELLIYLLIVAYMAVLAVASFWAVSRFIPHDYFL